MKNLILFILFLSPFLSFSQNVGIGTLTPQAPLHIKGENSRIRLHSPLLDGPTYLRFGNTSNNVFAESGLITSRTDGQDSGMDFRLNGIENLGMNLDFEDSGNWESAFLELRHPESNFGTGDFLGFKFFSGPLSLAQISMQQLEFEIFALEKDIQLRCATNPFPNAEPIFLTLDKNHRAVVIDTSELNFDIQPNSLLVVNGKTQVEELVVKSGAQDGYVLKSDSEGKASWSSLGNSDNLNDEDGDTKVLVEKTFDEDVIRFEINGEDYARMDSNTFHLRQGGSNVNIGFNAGVKMEASVSQQLAIGDYAGSSNESGNSNTMVGASALSSNKSGGSNVAIGYQTGGFDTLSSQNVFIGYRAGASINNPHMKSENVMIGFNAGRDALGSQNIFLGYNAGRNALGDNKLYISNTDTSNPLIYGEFDNEIVVVNGTLRISELVRLKPQIVVPGCSTSGDIGLIYFDDGDQKLRVCTNTGWKNLH